MQRFETPAGADEFGGEVIEELGMSRCRARDAEVVGRRHQASAKMMLPDSIHRAPREGGMGWVKKPIREGEAAAGSLRGWRDDSIEVAGRGEDRGNARFDRA